MPQVYSSATADGIYTPEVNMLVDTTIKRLTVPQTSGTRFYRVLWTSKVNVAGISLSGGNVVLSYQ